jgi:hypothetical protein
MKFISSRQRETEATHRRLAAEVKKFRAGEQGWFDGTPQSVDRRLVACNRALAAARGALERDPVDPYPLQIVGHLEDDQRALVGLREDLLTGCADRDPVRTASAPGAPPLSREMQRWVTLTSSQFVQANADCVHYPHELAIRARDYASRAASTHLQCREVTAAFVDAVLARARDVPQPRPHNKTAARDVCDLDGAVMFL